MLFEIAKNYPQMEFHIAGKYQELDLENWVINQEMDNVTLYPWQSNLNEFYSDKSYIINTSVREGCPVATLEAMACGLQPVILNWPGAKQIFDGYQIFDSHDIVFNYLDVDFETNRNFVQAAYNEEYQLNNFEILIEGVK